MSENSQVFKFSLPGDTALTVVGTAHVSKESVVLVEEVIREQQPDIIAVELDSRRLETLLDPDKWKNTDLYKVIKDGNAHLLFIQLLLQSFQKKISDELGVKPGAEMLRAVELSKELGVELICIDREIRTTLKRAWASASAWSLVKVSFAMLGSLFETSSTVSKDEIEKLKEHDALSAALLEFSELLPDVKESLIDERDRYMAEKLRGLPNGKKIVAVVGAGHVPGMTIELTRTNDLNKLDEIPAKRGFFKFSGWIFPAVILILIVAGAFFGGASTSTEMVVSWILITGTFSALGALLSLAHPLSILAAFISAPLTTLHPLLAAGWFSGLSEVALNRPRVSDLERVGEDLGSLRGWWRNRVSRILLVVLFTNLGASVGAIVATTQLLRSVF